MTSTTTFVLALTSIVSNPFRADHHPATGVVVVASAGEPVLFQQSSRLASALLGNSVRRSAPIRPPSPLGDASPRSNVHASLAFPLLSVKGHDSQPDRHLGRDDTAARHAGSKRAGAGR